jgi:diguanylate cyclase (GGDEF)-like protein
MKTARCSAFMLLFLSAFFCGCADRHFAQPKAQKGVLDLRDWDFGKNGTVNLDGEWEFYWDRLIPPVIFSSSKAPVRGTFITVPRPWNRGTVNGRELPPLGSATYRLTILMPPNDRIPDDIQLKISSIYSAYTCWINESLFITNGTISGKKEGFVGSMEPQICAISSMNDKVVITICAANQFFSIAGGINGHMILGKSGDILSASQRDLFFYIMSFGIFLILAVYHFWLWILKRSDRLYLIFSFICVLMALQSLFVSEKSISRIFINIDLRTQYQLWYLVFGIFPLAAMFYKEIFPDETNTAVNRIITTVFSACILLDIVLPSEIFTGLAVYFYAAGLAVIAYIYLINIKAVIRRRNFAKLFLLGLLIPSITGIHDVLHAMNLIETKFITPFGFLALMILESYLISLKLFRSFHEVQVLTEKLTALNSDLERTVGERTVSLEKALSDLRTKNREISRQNRKIEETNRALERANGKLHALASRDPLTGIANRRTFHEYFTYEWNKAMRNGPPVSVIFIDVDFFKEYNDTYGHDRGDRVLRKIGRTLANAAKRPGDLPARYGGEEFILFLVNTDIAGAEHIAEKTRNDIQKLAIPHKASHVSKYITVSMGIACAVPSKNISGESLIRSADQALYRAKRAGRNRIERA